MQKKLTHAKILDPGKKLWPGQRPTQKKIGPRKNIFDPRNPRKKLTHATHAPRDPPNPRTHAI